MVLKLTYSAYLESLCDNLYDHIRPRILYEPSLTVLQQVCTVLQALMVHDVDEEDEEFSPDVFSPQSPEEYFGQGGPFSPRPSLHRMSSRQSSMSGMSSVTLTRRRRRPLSRLHTEVLLNMVLQDAQARLVFRAQAVVQAQVAYYSPKPADLEWPEKLEGVAEGEPLVPRAVRDEDDDDPLFMHLPPEEQQETWYPTLRVTLSVLACLYSYIDVSFPSSALNAIGEANLSHLSS